MTVIVIDANILIAAMDATDVHHARAAGLLASGDGELCVPVLNLAEALVFQVRAGRGEAALTAILATGVKVLDANLLSALDLATERVESGLRMPDCVVLASARKLHAELATTDERLSRAASKSGVVLAI